MAEEKKTETAKVEEDKADDKVTEEEDKSADEDKSKKEVSSKEDKELDEELERERKGKPDPEKAKDAFHDREIKRKDKEDDQDEDLDEDDKPVTRRELKEIEERGYRRAQLDRARELANSMATSPKEGELIFLKWQNRSFPAHLSLQEQIEEAYAITNVRKSVGERNEALRALRGKQNTSKATEGDHKEGQKSGEPKLSDADKAAYAGAGLEWDGTKRLYKKALGRGKFLYKDPKSGRQWQG